MKRHFLVCAALAMVMMLPDDAWAIGGRGGGGRGGGFHGGMGGARPGGGMRPGGMPAGRPNMSAPQFGGGNRMARPSTGFPSANRPGAGFQPNPSRPGGGLVPSTRPATRPSYGQQAGGQRPGMDRFPGTSIPNLGESRPGRAPGIERPDLVNRPLPNRPNAGNFPGAAGRPDLANRPGNVLQPGQRPTPGGVSDFLGMHEPLRPGGAGGGAATRPGLANRPGASTLPARPGTIRPGEGNRPFRPDGNLNQAIHNRPGWANVGQGTLDNIQSKWQDNFRPNRPGGDQLANWAQNHPDRMDRWNDWANNVQDHWQNHHHDGCFGPYWWHDHPHNYPGWHYWHRFPEYGWGYWWTVPTWGALTNWFTWSAPANVWSQPAYYDYGQGGNVYYEDNSVYVGGEEVSSAEDFAKSAATLATVEPPANEQEAAQAEWMPLGTFAVSTSEKDIDPNWVIQLAVDKQGVISGTYYNTVSDAAEGVQGQVDKETQRVAFRIGDNQDVVVETGLYNLTQNEAPALVHFGTDRVENYLLVRLEQPDNLETASQ